MGRWPDGVSKRIAFHNRSTTIMCGKVSMLMKISAAGTTNAV